jgi:hypothetical protein
MPATLSKFLVASLAVTVQGMQVGTAPSSQTMVSAMGHAQMQVHALEAEIARLSSPTVRAMQEKMSDQITKNKAAQEAGAAGKAEECKKCKQATDIVVAKSGVAIKAHTHYESVLKQVEDIETKQAAVDAIKLDKRALLKAVGKFKEQVEKFSCEAGLGNTLKVPGTEDAETTINGQLAAYTAAMAALKASQDASTDAGDCGDKLSAETYCTTADLDAAKEAAMKSDKGFKKAETAQASECTMIDFKALGKP